MIQNNRIRGNNILTDADVKSLTFLGGVIKTALECDINGSGMPCRTDRFVAVEAMVSYLETHDYVVVKGGK